MKKVPLWPEIPMDKRDMTDDNIRADQAALYFNNFFRNWEGLHPEQKPIVIENLREIINEVDIYGGTT